MGGQDRATIEVMDGNDTVVTTWVLPVGARPDARSLDALCRLQLEARRFGWSIRLRPGCPRLGELVDLAGLAEVLGLPLQAEGQPEGLEEVGAEEVVVPRDAPTGDLQDLEAEGLMTPALRPVVGPEGGGPVGSGGHQP
ncbi:hypothetical protein BH23ACT2_BH23ACT2_06110 [soil metagenome]